MTQETALDILKLGYNVFLTGSAGSGKSYVLNDYIQYLKEQHIPVGITASTGIAATQISGITINSWAGIGIKQQLTQSDINDLLRRPYLRKRIARTSVLIIDEVSMLPDYVLDMLDQVCRAFKQSEKPFGGIQVVLCGDLFQLPPINHSPYHAVFTPLRGSKSFERTPLRGSKSSWRDSASPGVAKSFVQTPEVLSSRSIIQDDNLSNFIFNSQVWQQLDLKICYLEKEFRQEDAVFLNVLHEIRDNAITKPSIKTLAQRLYQPIDTISTRLYTHNVNVDMINNQELARLSGVAYTFSMTGKGNEFLQNIMKKSCLAPEQLTLKLGAKVMFVKNNFDRGYVNGTLGIVAGFDEKGLPIIETSGGDMVTVTSAEWMIEEDGEVKASIRQIPLRLAWAITIHKSQGMSIDAAEIDLGRPFTPGMGYVALSRVRKLEGIRLMGLNHKALLVNEEVLALDKELKAKSEKTVKELEELDWFELQVQQMLFIKEAQEEKERPNNYRQEYLYSYFD